MDNNRHNQEIDGNHNKEQTNPANEHTDIKWQQLSPIAILYFIASSFKQIFNNAIYLIPVLALNYKSILQHPFILIPSIIGLFLVLLVIAVISFKIYRFRLTDTSIEIRSGLLNKKHLNLPFERVQNVEIEQPIYFRLSGHACLQLDTAGSAKNEAKLIALRVAYAQQLKLKILDYKKQATDTNTASQKSFNSSTTNNDQEVNLNTRSLSDLVIHGITSNRVFILLGGLAPFYDKIAKAAGEGLQTLGINFSELFDPQTHSMFQIGLYAMTLTMLIMLVLVSFSILGSIISFYGYTLNKLDDRYIRRSGLLTKHEVSMRLSRLQMIVRKQDWLDVLLKRINLRFEQNNAIAMNGAAISANNKIIVPSVKPDECQALINDAYPNNILVPLINNNEFVPISKRFIYRYIFVLYLPLWFIASFVAWFTDNLPLIAVSTAAFAIFAVLLTLRWKRWGIARDEQFIYLRKGLLGVDYYCFPAFKVQQTKFMQSLLMKKRGLASVKFVLASGTLTAPFINESLANGLLDDCLYKVESSEKSWM